MAHELNQPLTVIKGAASYFLRKTRRSEPIAPETLSELSVEISGQVDRASDIINHMRAFGRKSDLALLDTDINGVVAQACDLFGRQPRGTQAPRWRPRSPRPCRPSSPSPTVWNR